MNEKCPICGLEVFGFEVVFELRNNPAVSNYIKLQHLEWNQNNEKICRNCFELYKKEFEEHQNDMHITGEPTVVKHKREIKMVSGDDENASIIILHGNNMGKRFEIKGNDIIIAGRSSTCDITVPEDNVSRQHAKVYRRNKKFVVEDLGSTNGTFVNTKRIEIQELTDGDIILIGNTILKFISGSNFEHKYHKELYRLATVDGLTQILNKNFFQSKLIEEFSRAKRYDRDLSFILMDLDHFHKLNNTYGHLAGDFILRNVASLISRNLRKEDYFGRYGGEEFAIILPEIIIDNAMILAEKLRSIVEHANFTFEGERISVTASIGVSTVLDEIGNENELVKKADEALYEAKASGRNAVIKASS
ncbi:MAG: diguanylate cyclase [Deltaproteobacteria bacterium]|nr:diguanylate cyclase [Deltaproteobacteria bacterium]